MLTCRKKLFVLTLSKLSSMSYSTVASGDERRRAIMAKGLPKQKPIDGVKDIILVASGKGGVGKSTVSVNLSVGLALEYPDKKIGLLDADVFGPSLPLMMNLKGKPDIDSRNLMIPLQNFGVRCMSMGFLVDEKQPVVWRGLMVMKAIDDLIRGVAWGPLDILVVDMPPGTGDTQLSFAQSVPITGAVIVTTPQKVALQDALKGAEMFRKTSVPILGFVLNMSTFICSKCNEKSPLPSTPIAIQTLETYPSAGLLAQIPFGMEMSQSGDEGKPIVLSFPQSEQAMAFRYLSQRIMKGLLPLGTSKEVSS